MNAQTQSNGTSILVQGRIVWTLGSDIFQGKVKTDDRTKQVIIDQKTGQPVVEYGFGLAIPKIDPRTGQNSAEYVKVWQALNAEALSIFPTGHIPQGFSMKYKDGDGVDHNGVPFSNREGHAGHIILACVTRIPIKYFRFEGGNNILVNNGFKCGDYVNVQLNIKAHPALGQSKAGLYVNPSAVQFIAAGKEIINTPSGDQLFGTQSPVYSGEVIAQQVPPMGMMNNQQPPMNNQMPPQQNMPMQGQVPPMQQQQYNQMPPMQNGYPQQY